MGSTFAGRIATPRTFLSRGFEAAAKADGFELVTAFEVLEHLVDPVPELAEMFRRGNSVLCTTQILPATSPKPGEWWYYALYGGQHVSLFTLESLHRLAARFGRRLISDGVSVHLHYLSASRGVALPLRRPEPR